MDSVNPTCFVVVVVVVVKIHVWYSKGGSVPNLRDIIEWKLHDCITLNYELRKLSFPTCNCRINDTCII